ncbi:TetR family transcriptional regulator [Streptosporangium sp. DT93]|uniref:TetR family transcriptional regulator n=1 Tax=Streptosporangium sp. DT93 TaxID=3393428 RepID=UPI003CE74884
MNDEPGTRARILETARALFAANGYQRTSLREIAERLDLTKTAVLYHFPAKADILDALAEPLLRDLEAAIAVTGPPDPGRDRWALMENLVDVYLAHRGSLRMILRDVALFAQDSAFQRFVAVMTEANRLVSGPDPDLRERVRAAQAIAMLSDPVILLADTPGGALRREVLAGVRRLFAEGFPESGETGASGASPGDGPHGPPEVPAEARPPALPDPPGPTRPSDLPGPSAAPASGAPARRHRSGRPGAMTPDMVELARRMDAGGSHTMAEIAAALGVSRATLYRYLSPPSE